MATKAKTLLVKDKEKDDKAADAPRRDSSDAPSPLLDLSDAAVKKMIKQAKERGFRDLAIGSTKCCPPTPPRPNRSKTSSMLSDMGINVRLKPKRPTARKKKKRADDDTDNELVEVTQKAVTEVKKSEPGERTDDPVPYVSREMGTVELLSREGPG